MDALVWFLVGACFVVAGGLWILNRLASKLGEIPAKAVMVVALIIIVVFALSLATPEELDKMIAPFKYLWGG